MPGQSFYVIPEKRHEQRIQKMNLETLIVCVVIQQNDERLKELG